MSRSTKLVFLPLALEGLTHKKPDGKPGKPASSQTAPPVKISAEPVTLERADTAA